MISWRRTDGFVLIHARGWEFSRDGQDIRYRTRRRRIYKHKRSSSYWLRREICFGGVRYDRRTCGETVSTGFYRRVCRLRPLEILSANIPLANVPLFEFEVESHEQRIVRRQDCIFARRWIRFNRFAGRRRRNLRCWSARTAEKTDRLVRRTIDKAKKIIDEVRHVHQL